MPVGQKVYGAKQPKDMTDAELLDQLQGMQRQITDSTSTANNERYGYTSGGLYQRLYDQAQAEITRREQEKKVAEQEQKTRGLYDQLNASAGGGAAAFDPADYERMLQESAQGQRRGINDIYNNQQQGLLQGLDERYNPVRKQAIEEAAVLGNLRSPAFQSSTLSNIDAQRSRDTSSGLAQLGASRGQALIGVEQGLANQLGQGRQFGASLGQQERGLQFQKANSLANLLQGNQQFGQNFGLEQNKYLSGLAQTANENMMNQQALTLADQLGQARANAGKKSDWEMFGDIAGGIGNLAGGIGGLVGGLKGLGGGIKPKGLSTKVAGTN